MVTGDNNNKFYDMHDNNDGTFAATWGRIGVTSTSKTYPIKDWARLLREKTKKGYADQSHLFMTTSAASDLVDIKDAAISKFVYTLRSFASKSVSDNYTVDASKVTQAQVNEAQKLIDELSNTSSKRSLDPEEINDTLLKLYAVIPRKMLKVQHHLVDKKADTTAARKALSSIIGNEQDTLDVMAAQVTTIATTTANTDKTHNILDVAGLAIEQIAPDDPEYKRVAKMVASSANIQAIYRVSLSRTENAFSKNLGAAKNKTTELYWHGSRNENWWGILQTGLLIRPSNAVITGKMFGYGIYGADKFQKSYGYTSGSGSYWARGSSNTALLGIFEFHMGNTKKVSRWEPDFSSLTYNKLHSRFGDEYDSLSAAGGYDLRNNEYIVYQEKQLTVRYVVQVKG